MNEKIRKECYRRVRTILKTELNSANRIQAINTLPIPVVTYSFNIINWDLSDIKKMDRKICKLLTCNRMHHPKPDVKRLYVSRREGGRWLMQSEMNFKTTTIGLHKYLSTTNDWMLELVLFYDAGGKKHSISKQSNKFKQEFNLQDQANETAKREGLKEIKETWENKPLHGQYSQRIQQDDVDQENTHKWLHSVGLKAETEGFVKTAQDRIIKNGVDPKCRMCAQYDETVDYLISAVL